MSPHRTGVNRGAWIENEIFCENFYYFQIFFFFICSFILSFFYSYTFLFSTVKNKPIQIYIVGKTLHCANTIIIPQYTNTHNFYSNKCMWCDSCDETSLVLWVWQNAAKSREIIIKIWPRPVVIIFSKFESCQSINNERKKVSTMFFKVSFLFNLGDEHVYMFLTLIYWKIGGMRFHWMATCYLY